MRRILAVSVLVFLAHMAWGQASVDESQETAVYWVDVVNGSDSNAGTQQAPFQTIGKAAAVAEANNQAGTGSQININPGIYREQVNMKALVTDTALPITFQAVTPGTVIMSGADPFTGWQAYPANSNIYSTVWPYQYGLCSADSGGGPFQQDIVLRREVVFVNGAPLTQVLNLGQMQQGTFAVDESNAAIYIWPANGTDMGSADVEVGTRDSLLSITNKSDVVIRGMTFQYSNGCRAVPPLNITGSDNILLDSDAFYWNNSVGPKLYQDSLFTVQNMVSNHNGAGGVAEDQNLTALWSANTTNYNNWRGAQGAYYLWSASGFHPYAAHGATIAGLTSAFNQTYGIHWDTDNRDITADRMVISENLLAESLIEKSEGPISITNSYFCGGNPITSWQQVGFWVRNSGQISLSNSVIANDSQEFDIVGTPGGYPVTDWQTGQNYNLIAQNITLNGSTFVGNNTGQNTFYDSNLGGDDWTAFQTTFLSDNNTWWNPLDTTAFLVPVPTNNTQLDFPTFQATTGQDVHSSFAQPADGYLAACSLTPEAPDFWLITDWTHSLNDISAGASTSFTLTAVAFGGFTGPISLTSDGLQNIPGATYSWDTTTINTSGTATLTVNTAPGTPTGVYPITVVANHGALSRTLTVSVLVNTVLAVAPEVANLGSSGVGSTSLGFPVTLANLGPNGVNITSITTTGDFSQTNTCGNQVGGTNKFNFQCSITLLFTPTAVGARTGTLTIVADDPGSPITVPLSGVGIGVPILAMSPNSMIFPDTPVNSSSSPSAVTLTNTGTGDLSITSIAVGGLNALNFSQTNTCGASLPAGASCTVNVTFTPNATGTRTAYLTTITNAIPATQILLLTGNGVAPAVSLSPGILTFPSTNVNSSSAPMTATLSNDGAAPLNITSILLTGMNPGAFSQSNTCGVSVPEGASCTITVTFTPLATGSPAANVTITDNASPATQTVSLSGTAVAPAVSASPLSFIFPSTTQNASSAPVVVTLTNTGSGPLIITSTVLGGVNAGDFAQTNTCPISPDTLAVNAACTITATFTPTALGSRSATITVNDNVPAGPKSISMSGTGIGFAVNFTPASLSFSNTQVGAASTAKTITLKNLGTVNLNIGNIQITGLNPDDFAQTNSCGVTVAPSATCAITVTFTPLVSGSRSASLSVTDNGDGSPQSVPLNGTGIQPVAVLTPATLVFATQQYNTLSATQKTTLTNNGSGSMTITGISITGMNSTDFTQTNNCPLSPGTLSITKSCTITVTFTPQGMGARAASLSITDNAPASPQTASLSGTGTFVKLSPTSVTFSAQTVGKSSAGKLVTFTNVGNATLTMNGISITGANAGDFTQTNTCGTTIAAGANCTVTVTFTPTAAGARSANLYFDDSDGAGAQTVPLSGTGSGPAAALAPASLTFGNQPLGSSSTPQTVTLTNTGTDTLSLTGVAVTNDFSQTNTCGTSVAAGASCSITVTFTPSISGTENGTLSVSDNAIGSPQLVALSGTGTAPAVTLSPGSMVFGNQLVGTSSAPQPVILTNIGNDTLTIASIGATADFSQTNTCGASVSAGASCIINVSFSPSVTGTEGGALSVYDSATGSPHTVSLSGTGTGPTLPAVSLSAGRLTFDNQQVGTTSAAQSVILASSGTDALNITSLSASGDFAETDNCVVALPPGTTCTINVTFTPSLSGPRTGTITITDNAGDSPQAVTLSGSGTIILNPVPQISEPLVPAAAVPGSTGITLTINGAGFTSTATVMWNGNPLVTTFVSSTQLTAAVSGPSLASAGVATVTVSNPQAGGGTSNPTLFDITGPTPSVVLSGPEWASGTQPQAVVAQDLDQDGHADLVVANSGSNSVSVLLGIGDSTFQPRADYATGASPVDVKTGDFNRDGKLDLASANFVGNSVSVILGNGDGTFQSKVDYATDQSPTALAAADFNADGNLDLAIVNSAANTVSILLGNGDGTFQDGIEYATGSSPGRLVSGDFNRDNKTDLAVCNAGDGTLSVLLGNGDGTLQPALAYPAVSGCYSVATADLNGDGTLDLIAGSPVASTVSILLGNGDGTFLAPVSYPVSGATASVAAADANGDGLLDLLVGVQSSHSISILSGNGDGSFQAALIVATGNGPSAIGVGDFNGDGRLDMAVADASDNAVSLLVQAPTTDFSSSSLSFGNQSEGITSAPLTTTLTNSGSATLVLGTITVTGTNSGDFSQTNTCGATLTAGTSCTITVTFTPSGTGAETAAINIADNGPASPQTVNLDGTGTAPAVTLAPTSIGFGNQLVGSSSSPQVITLTNSGTGTLSITSISASGDFSQTNTCGTSVEAEATCTISVIFSPSTTGAETEAVTINDNVAGSPQSVNVSGTGTAPAVTLAPTSIDFGNQQVGTSSTPQTVILTNSGSATLNVTSVALTGLNPGAYTMTNTCGTSVAAGAGCTITVTFSPALGGAATANVTVTDDASPATQTVALSGNATAPSVLLAPATLIFPSTDVNSSSAPLTATLTNTGSATLNIGSIALTGSNAGVFSQTNNCGSAVAAGASCTITVTFTPLALGSPTASVTISDNASPAVQSATLNGSAVAPVLTMSPPSVNFPSTTDNTTSAPMVVTLTNTGTGPLIITSMVLGGINPGDFAQTNTCPISPGSLAVNGSCAITATFTPTVTGSRSATITVNDNVPTGPQSIAMSGTGVGLTVTYTPASLSFSNTQVGSTSTAKTVTLKNTGTINLNITGVQMTGANPGDFSQTNNCGTTIAPNATCTFAVTFKPQASGLRSATLTVSDDGYGSPQGVPLTGSGNQAVVSLSPTSLVYATQQYNTNSKTQTMTLTNTGTASLAISGISFTGTNVADFSQTNTCPTSPNTLAAGKNCTITVTFTPKGMGARTASLNISDNAPASPQAAALSGTGTFVKLTPTSVSFSSVSVGHSSSGKTVTFSNIGNTSLTMNSISITGANPGDFSQTNNCATKIAAGASCTLTVTFKPTATGPRTANIYFNDSDGAGPQTVPLTGTGT